MGFEYQSTDGADGNAFAAVLATGLAHRLIPKSGDYSPEAAVSKTNDSLAQFFLAYPNTFAAKHAFVRVVNEQGTARIYG
jgi:hypothetical protein